MYLNPFEDQNLIRLETGLLVSARCTNAGAFVHKTLTKSAAESLGTRLFFDFNNLSNDTKEG